MTDKRVEFFKVMRSGEPHYIVASSRQAVLDHLGDRNDRDSIAFFGRYDVTTLKQVSKQEAMKTRHYESFITIANSKLHRDGTYDLGSPREYPVAT